MPSVLANKQILTNNVLYNMYIYILGVCKSTWPAIGLLPTGGGGGVGGDWVGVGEGGEEVGESVAE